MTRRAGDTVFLARSDELIDGGSAIPFRVIRQGRISPAFLVRYAGQVRSFLNVCPHVGLRLNRESNDVFDRDKRHLHCRQHGARFDPLSGDCLSGPCLGFGLIPLEVRETAEGIFFLANAYDHYSTAGV